MARPKLEAADLRTRARLARAAAELASAAEDVEQRVSAAGAAQRAVATARRDYAESWDDFAGELRAAHQLGVSIAELSRITGYGVGFIRPIVLGVTTAPRPQGRRARQVGDRP